VKLRPIDRLMKKVHKLANGCWQWTGCIHSTGYGRFGLRSDFVEYAHRASYILHKGEIPVGMYCCHTCDNRWCVNPDHIFIGSAKDNMQDAKQKGRIVMPTDEQRLRGENQPRAKLSNDQVRSIRNSHETNKLLAALYSVDPAVISNIRLGKTYRSVV
jgi:hypothetical protein